MNFLASGYFIIVVIALFIKAIRKGLGKEGKEDSIVGTLLGSGRANIAPTGRVEPSTPPVTPPPTAKLDDWDEEDDWGESHYFSADERGEGHVASVGLSRERQLEQLEVWKAAGLIDEDEYKERKRKIKRG